MSIFSYLRSHLVVSTVVGLGVVVIAVIGGRAASQKAPAENTSGIKQVSVIDVAAFRKGNVAVSANGVVESHSQADLRSQSSAPVALIDASIGQSVSAGQVILELQNSDIRAQFAQAQATLALAQGQFSTGATSLESAKQAAIDKIRDSYNKTYDAVVSTADPILYNNDGNGGRLASLSVDASLNSEITSIDIDLKKGFADWKAASDALTSSVSADSIEKVVKLSQANMTKADLLLSDVSKVLNGLATYAAPALSASLTAWKTTISGAHSSLSGASQALTAAEMGLNTSSSSQGSTAQAQISVAQAGVTNLQAQLAKTIIRSPISGKVSALPLRAGELATPGTLLATVVGNDSGLEIKAYVSAEDLSRIQVGAPVAIQSQVQDNGSGNQSAIKGTVSNVAPSVDATTKKAEVDIDVANGPTSGLVIGQNVSVSITPLGAAAGKPATSGPTTYLLPIQNVKIVPGEAYVFTVDQDSKIKRNDVTLGKIQGDFIEVTAGLVDGMQIVTPVYELDAGQTVKVQ